MEAVTPVLLTQFVLILFAVIYAPSPIFLPNRFDCFISDVLASCVICQYGPAFGEQAPAKATPVAKGGYDRPDRASQSGIG